MNITFLLGNGFDIGLGLKTRYEDFYRVYQNSKQGDNQNIREFKGVLQKRNKENQIIDWSDFEKAFGEHSCDFTEGQEFDYLDRFKDFLEKFNAYLEEENSVADYSDANYIGESMLKGVTEYFHIRDGSKNEILQRYHGTDRVYNFISFNYTNSVDKCTEVFSDYLDGNPNHRSVGRVVHLHGYIEKNMILGVNDKTQIKNEAFANNPKVANILVKPKQNNILKTTYDTKAENIIDTSDIICIYGMSIGETDKYWWDYISKWLLKSKNHALVVLAHDKKFNIKFPYNQQELMENIQERFLSFSTLSNDSKKTIVDRVYIEFNHDVFEMDLCKIREHKKNENLTPPIIERINNIEEELAESNIIEF